MITRVINTTDGGESAASAISEPGPWQLTEGDTLSITLDGATPSDDVVFRPVSVATLEGTDQAEIDLAIERQ